MRQSIIQIINYGVRKNWHKTRIGFFLTPMIKMLLAKLVGRRGAMGSSSKEKQNFNLSKFKPNQSIISSVSMQLLAFGKRRIGADRMLLPVWTGILDKREESYSEFYLLESKFAASRVVAVQKRIKLDVKSFFSAKISASDFIDYYEEFPLSFWIAYSENIKLDDRNRDSVSTLRSLRASFLNNDIENLNFNVSFFDKAKRDLAALFHDLSELQLYSISQKKNFEFVQILNFTRFSALVFDSRSFVESESFWIYVLMELKASIEQGYSSLSIRIDGSVRVLIIYNKYFTDTIIENEQQLYNHCNLIGLRELEIC